ncbi:MAG: ribosome biogenesis GTP-binding protein YihA/YsxC [Bacteroidota bacterium]
MLTIKNARFVISNTDISKCPKEIYPEYAFIGRSNVGKSSLINYIVNHKDLAKTSAKPGKTQLINHFIINETDKPWYLVDLPGYGYAKVSKSKIEQWEEFISEYLINRKNLTCVFVLIDSRLEPQTVDMDFMQWLGEKGVPFVMVFTKTDKLTRNELNKNLDFYNKIMKQYWAELPTQFITTAEKKSGKENILKLIEETNKDFKRVV